MSKVIETEADRENARRGRYTAALDAVNRRLPEGWRLVSVRPDSPGEGALVTMRVPF